MKDLRQPSVPHSGSVTRCTHRDLSPHKVPQRQRQNRPFNTPLRLSASSGSRHTNNKSHQGRFSRQGAEPQRSVFFKSIHRPGDAILHAGEQRRSPRCSGARLRLPLFTATAIKHGTLPAPTFILPSRAPEGRTGRGPRRGALVVVPRGRVLKVELSAPSPTLWLWPTEANNEARDGFRSDAVELMGERLERRLAGELAKKRQGDSGKRFGLWMHVPVWSCEPSRSASKANQPRSRHICFSLGNAMVAAQVLRFGPQLPHH